MPAKRKEATAQVAVLSNCRHYWIIDSSQQVESKGRCQLCGEERVFQNKLSSASRKQEAVVDGVPVDGPVLRADDPGLPPDEDEALRPDHALT
jgi:hypothetical protein